MDNFPLPYLSLLTFLPLVGFLAIVFLAKKDSPKMAQTIAMVFTAADLLLSLPLFFRDWSGKGMQLVEDVDWIPTLGIHYKVGIDGFAALLILLTTVLGFIAVYSSFTAITHRQREYYAFLLFLQTGMIGVFCALDFVLFYFFWEVMLLPMYFLIGVWGGPRKLYAAIKFFLYTLFGSVVMLLGILALYFWNTTGLTAIDPSWTGLGNAPSFDVAHFLAVARQMPPDLQLWLFAAFFLGFAIKVPMFPFHTWLPDAHVEAPTAGSVILAGVLLKMGTYGFVRFSLPMFPSASSDGLVLSIVAGLSLIGIVYGSLVAMMQKDMKKLVAYSSVAHMGFVMIGLFALNPMGLRGGILQMINHGVSTGALFLLVGIVYERRHTRMIADYGGLSKSMPIYAAFFLLITMSSIGLPGLNGFVGEFTILVGAFAANWRWGFWAGLGIVLGAAYMLWMYQRVFFGPLDKKENQEMSDLNWREAWTLIPLAVAAIWIGIYPTPFFRMIESPVEQVMEALNSARPMVVKHTTPAGAPAAHEADHEPTAIESAPVEGATAAEPGAPPA